jgi:hypothetical protein
MSAKKSHDDHNGKGGGLDGLLGGLSQLMESLSDLAKTGQELRESSKTWEVERRDARPRVQGRLWLQRPHGPG